MSNMQTRRSFFISLAAVSVPGMALATNDQDFDPWDRIRRRYSKREFLRLSEADVYEINLALRRGNRVLLAGCKPSESREIFKRAGKDLAGTKEWIKQQRHCVQA